MNPLILANLNSHDLGLAFALASMLFGLSIGALAMYLSHRRRVMWHETARLALEKGIPIPAEPDEGFREKDDPKASEDAQERRRIRGHIMGGMINLALAGGLYVAMVDLSPQTARFAAVPGFIGAAFLIMAVIEAASARGGRSSGDR